MGYRRFKDGGITTPPRSDAYREGFERAGLGSYRARREAEREAYAAQVERERCEGQGQPGAHNSGAPGSSPGLATNLVRTVPRR